jgi:3-hydroxyacyl-[acyl-carrier-protein] dehydratase
MTREDDRNQTPDTALDIHAVLRLLPHRYPFLLIDRVLRYTAGESLTYNEPFFNGHFPVRPVMPGVLILEAMAQATGILAFRTVGAQPSDGTLYYLVGIDKARFKRPVEPGDRIVIDVRVLRTVRNIWFFEAEARVDDELVASAEMMCAAKDIQN